MQRDIRCIALDLDHTTLRMDGTLSDRTKEALCGAVAAGIQVVIVSGRAFSTLPAQVLEIPGIDYAVTSNGAASYYKKQRIHSWMLSSGSAEQILKIAEPYFQAGKFAYECFVDGRAYAGRDFVDYPQKFDLSESTVRYIRETRMPVSDITMYIHRYIRRLDSLDLIFSDLELGQKLKAKFLETCDDIYITSAIFYRMEISHRDSGKAAGLRDILRRIGVSEKHTAAFGDGENDAEMLKAAGLGVAVANAHAHCLQAADLVTGTNDEDGVAAVIESWLG